MAKYKITYQCGCTEIVQLYGSPESRKEQVAHLKTELCRNCRSAIAASQARQKGMPTLTGSAKQILWAETIRHDALTRYELLKSSCDPNMVPSTQIELLLRETDAHWWIENRHHFKSFNSFLLFVNATLVA